MTLEELLERVENGTCPFTGKAYNCARCKGHSMSDERWTGARTLHICLCITQPLTHRHEGWDNVLQYYPREDRNAIQEGFARLLQLGVENVPMSSECGFDHFCFKKGCIGHTKKGGK